MGEYKKLNNQPLKFVLSEFRFSQVLQIKKFIPQLQERYRKKYPGFENRSDQALHLLPGGIKVDEVSSWLFFSADKKNAIEVSQERLVFFTSDYPRYEGFEAACSEALDALIEIVDPGLITRIGLRYGDLVTVEEGLSISDLVDTHLVLPPALDASGDIYHQRNESLLKTTAGVLAVRSLYGFHNLACMPDVKALPVIIENKEEASERMVLDFDHFWQAGDESVRFDKGGILTKLSEMHEISRAAFWQITTEYARTEKWA